MFSFQGFLVFFSYNCLPSTPHAHFLRAMFKKPYGTRA